MRIVALSIVMWWAAALANAAEPKSLAEDARSLLGADQGVYVEAASGKVLLAQAAALPVHPASVSKVPTTLALLRKLGPEHRFVTTFSADGPVVGTVLRGDLLVGGSGDPGLVDEDALLIADRLVEMGIRQVAGGLRVRGTLTFDWQPDEDGSRLSRALTGLISPEALEAVRAFEREKAGGPSLSSESARSPGIRFIPRVTTSAASAGTTTSVVSASVAAVSAAAGSVVQTGDSASSTLPERLLVTHRSQPLIPLAKSLNDYSNNIFKPLADAAGGAEAVEGLARSVVPEEMRSEITLGDGAGTDPRNRLSPRAAVTLLRALEKELRSTGHELFDILPVSGIDDGTLRRRLDGPDEVGRIVGKTGTFGDYGASALVGAISTSDQGTVYFAILNHGVPVPEARHRQDKFVRALLAHLRSRPWGYQRDVRPAIARAEVLKAP